MKLAGVLSFGMALLPLAIAPGLLDISLAPKLFYLSVLGFCLCFIMIKHSKLPQFEMDVVWLKMGGLLMLYPLWLLFGLFWSVFPEQGYFQLIQLLCLFSFGTLLFFLLKTNVTKEKDIVLALRYLLLILISLGLLFRFALPFRASLVAMGFNNILGNDNLLASSIAILMLLIVFSGFYPSRRHKVVWSAALLLLGGLLLVLMRSKTAMLAFVFCFLLGLFLGVKKQHKSKIMVALAALVLCVIFAVKMGAFNFLTQYINLNSAFERGYLWKGTLEMISSNFFMGYGPGTWRIVFPSFGVENLAVEVHHGNMLLQRPHNDYLWILSESGAVGFLLFLLPLGFLFYKWLKSDSDGFKKNIPLMLSFVCFGIIAFFSYPKERMLHGFIYVVLLVLILNGLDFSVKNTRKFSVKRSFFMVLAVLFAFCAHFAFGRIVGEHNFRKGHHYTLQGKFVAAEKHYNKVNTRYIHMDYKSTSLNYHKAINYLKMNKLKEAERFLKAALVDNPYHIHTLNNLAAFSGSRNDYFAANQYYTRLVSVSPYHPQACFFLYSYAYKQGDKNKALSYLLQAKPLTKEDRIRNKDLIKKLRKEISEV